MAKAGVMEPMPSPSGSISDEIGYCSIVLFADGKHEAEKDGMEIGVHTHIFV